MEPERVTGEELSSWPLFEGESTETLEWIASQMVVRNYSAGEQVIREGDPANEFFVVLGGEIHFRRASYDGILIAHVGEAAGVLPFSRMKTWGGRGWAAQDVRLGVMSPSNHRELVYRAPILAQRLVGQMTDRTREFTRMEESSNRLLALGKLSAGLAHELNNPASAAVRSSARLRDVLTERRGYGLALRAVVLPERARDIMVELGERITECASSAGSVDALARADREADIADWLESQGVAAELSPGLADAGLNVDRISQFEGLVPAEVLSLGLRILIADHEILCLARELEDSSRRVSELVQSVKTYTYMDQSPIAEVDIEQGIEVTLRMFQHQLKHGVEVVRQYAAGLPRICANGSALNQVWTNLIDNAIDALESLPAESPKVLTIKTCVEPSGILVEIADSGPGIPPDAVNRIFEPFFTTKPVGQGTGLGLDIVQRIVRKHKGTMRVESQPGRTAFQVRLPVDSQ